MVESIVGAIVGLFEGFTSIPFGKELVVFIISLMPILELRGGLIAAALLDLNPSVVRRMTRLMLNISHNIILN